VLFQFHFNVCTVKRVVHLTVPDLAMGGLGSRYQVNMWESVNRMHFLIL